MKYADVHCVRAFKIVIGTDGLKKFVYVYTGKCIQTGKRIEVCVPIEELAAYRRGQLIQNAMPSLTAGEREFLMTGISDEGWKIIFKDKEGEE